MTDASLSPAGKSWVADTVFLTLLSIFLGCAHHAVRSDRPLFAAPVNPAYEELQSMTASEVRPLLGKSGVLFVDARTEEAFREGTIPTSLSLPLHSDLTPERIGQLGQAKIVIVFCSNQKCGASKELAVLLLERGLANVKIYPGGFQEWRSLGYPSASGGS